MSAIRSPMINFFMFIAGFVALVDFPALSNSPGHRNEGNTLSTLCGNLASERLSAFTTTFLFPQVSSELQTAQGLPSSSICKPLPLPSSINETIRVLTNQPGGLMHIIDDQSVRKGKTEKSMLDAMGARWGKNRQFTWRKESDSAASRAGTFTIEHWNDSDLITYSSENFLEKNLNLIPSDLVELLGGKAIPQMNTAKRGANRKQGKDPSQNNTTIIGGSSNPFVRELFASEVLAAAASESITMSKPAAALTNEREEGGSSGLVVMGSRPSRRPSMRRKGTTRKTKDQNEQPGPTTPDVNRGATLARKNTVSARRAEMLSHRCILGGYNTSLNDLFDTLSESCRMSFLLCLSPQAILSEVPGQYSLGTGVDVRFLKSQIKALQLHSIRDRGVSMPHWVVDMDFKEFWDRYAVLDRWQEHVVKRAAPLVWKDKMLAVKEEMDWTDLDFAIGIDKV